MAYSTTYTCDKCKKSAVDDRKFLTLVAITLPEEYSTYQSRKEVAKAEWCRACIVAAGLVFPQKGEEKPDPKPLIEDVIRDIVRDVIQEQH